MRITGGVDPDSRDSTPGCFKSIVQSNFQESSWILSAPVLKIKNYYNYSIYISAVKYTYRMVVDKWY